MKTSNVTSRLSQPQYGSNGNRAGLRTGHSICESHGKNASRVLFGLFLAALVAISALQGKSQIASPMVGSPAATTVATAGQLDLTYVRPTQRTMVNNYVFDAFGPYPLSGAAVAAGINQFGNVPPEWNQGLKGYSRRFGSDFGIVVVGTTARYTLAEAFKEDTLYYRCECTGMFPRVRHALVSTLIARRGEDGHRVFSFPALVAPYAGTMTAVYGWFPGRFGAKDAFRMGNYNLLAYAGGNIALEFLYSGPHSLVARMHLNNLHGAPNPGPNHSGPDNSGPNH
ncbi:MAG: hypothetical protein ABR987_09460 [Terracidiphilus sp.]|jgi:hypothetical protein